jgi:hypothetical protein
MEVAASLTELGIDVTLVSRDVDLFAQLRSPEISDDGGGSSTGRTPTTRDARSARSLPGTTAVTTPSRPSSRSRSV